MANSTSGSSIVPFIVHAEGTGVSQRLVTAGKAHAFATDTYPAFGGRDEAPSPLAYALGSLSSCNQITAAIVARELGVRLGTWSFDVQGDLDPAVLVTGAEGNANFQRVSVRATVETDASAEQFATLVRETERRCPVTQLFKRSGLDFDNQWTPRLLTTAAAVTEHAHTA